MIGILQGQVAHLVAVSETNCHQLGCERFILYGIVRSVSICAWTTKVGDKRLKAAVAHITKEKGKRRKRKEGEGNDGFKSFFATGHLRT